MLVLPDSLNVFEALVLLVSTVGLCLDLSC